MNRTLVAVLFVSLLGVTYTRSSVNRPPTVDERATGQSDAAKTAQSSNDDQTPADPDDPQARIEQLLKGVPRIVLATVPDPEITGLRLHTDRTIGSVLLAGSQLAHPLQDAWLPWSATPPLKDLKYEDRLKEERGRRERRKFPGVLKLRDLAILLVPETPTAGINLPVLDKAMELAGEGKRQLIGPCFTGSLRPLKGWLEKNDRLSRVVTGTLVGYQPGLDLPGVELERVLHQVSDSQRLLQEFFRQTKWHPFYDNLVEDSTVFGTSQGGDESIRYPWQISRLRNAVPEASAPTQGGPLRVPLLLRDLHAAVDIIPSYAPSALASSQDVVLSQISRLLSTRGTDIVAITSSDVADALFLTKFLRVAAPDLRVLYFDSDLLALRARDGTPHMGSLSVSAFPLSPWLQRLGDPRLILDSEWSNGVFQAATRVISSAPLLRETCDPLWVAVLGSNGFWPVASLKNDTINYQINRRQPLIWNTVFWASFMLSIVWLTLLVWARRTHAPWCHVFAVPRDWNEEKLRSWAHKRGGLLILISCVLAFGHAVQGLPAWMPHGPTPIWITAAFWIGLLFYVLAGFVPVLDMRRQWWKPLLVPTFVAAVFAAASLFVDRYHQLEFFLMRCQDYTSGVSPSLPVLLIAFGYLACSLSLFRKAIYATEGPHRIGTECQSETMRNFFYLACRAGDSFRYRSLRTDAQWTVAGPALVSAGVFAAGHQYLHSVEHKFYESLYLLFLGLLLFWVLHSTCRLVYQWYCVKALLRAAETHPIRFVLSELPKEVASSPILSTDRGRSYILFGRSMDCLLRLKATMQESQRLWPGLDHHIRLLRDFLIEVQSPDIGRKAGANKGECDALQPSTRIDSDDLIRKKRQLVRDLAEFTTVLYVQLENNYWTGGSSELEKPGGRPMTAWRIAEEFIGLRWVSFVRYTMLQMRNQLIGIILGFVAIVLSLNSYPFGRERVIAAFLVVLMVGIGSAVVWVLAHMHRDAALSRITETKEGELGAGFYWKILGAGALPALSLLASYSPTVGRYLTAWLQPAMEALR